MKRIVLSLAIAAALCACGSKDAAAPSADNTPAAPAPAAAPEPAKPEPAKAEPPSDHVDDPSFLLAAKPVGQYTAGKLGSVAISLTPRGEYHVNQDYPISVSLSGDSALQFPKPTLGKSELAELNLKIARFDVPVTPQQAGTHSLTAKIKFAVCTDANCVPDERTLALALAVE